MDRLSLRQTEDKPLGQIGQLLGWSRADQRHQGLVEIPPDKLQKENQP